MAGASPKRRKMLVVCPFPVGVAPGQRLKYEQYFDDWRALGWDIVVSSYMDMATWRIVYEPGHQGLKAFGLLKGHLRRLRDVFRISRYDLVYVHMWVTPLATTWMERLARRLARRLVYDLEDNVFSQERLRGKANPNYWVDLFKGPRKALFLSRKADHVITSSPVLNETCARLNERGASTYISSSVDTGRFVPRGARPDGGKVVIGWTGTHSTRILLDLLRPVFQRLAARLPFRLKVIGNFDYELEGVDLEVVRWSAEREVEDMQSLDIGVYPLWFNDQVTGKSGLKAIQYMAFGIPTVATPAGITPMIVRDGENGLLVRTDDEWVEALERLALDSELRRKLGEAARRDALAKYSTKVIAGEYRRVLANVMGQDQ